MKSLGQLALLACTTLVFAQSSPAPQGAPAAPSLSSSPSRQKVDAEAAAALKVQSVPPKYPEAALKAGIQGTVVLAIVTNTSGDVQDVTVVYGNPVLTQAATDAVRQWKYKPYLVEGSPVEMETQVTVNFQIQSRTPVAPPPLGKFDNGSYVNEFFGLYYPLSRDWVLETEAMRKRASDTQTQGTYVLLSAVHIPQNAAPLRADSSFTVLAVNRSSNGATQNCKQYLESLGSSLQSNKEGKQKGEVSEFSVAGHDFFRGNFEYRHGMSDRAVVCESLKDYRLLWNIVAWSKSDLDTGVSTLNAISAPPPSAKPVIARQQGTPIPTHVRVSEGVSTGLLIKKVAPIYPMEARYAHIQGSVRLNVVINKTGDIVDLEVIEGPMELVVSAVNAVRQWKYRPYLLMGEPVTVNTQIVVNYTLSW